MKKYAVIDLNNVVVNVSLWDGETPWEPGFGYTAVGIGTTTFSFVIDNEEESNFGDTITKVFEYPVEIGWKYDPATRVFSSTEVIVDTSWDDLREKRNAKLKASDWKILPGGPYESKIEEWKTYRQQLRDLPANTSDPKNVTWPTRPS